MGILLDHLPINEQHTAWFDPATLKQLLNRHGFTVEKQELYPLPVGARGWRISPCFCQVKTGPQAHWGVWDGGGLFQEGGE